MSVTDVREALASLVDDSQRNEQDKLDAARWRHCRKRGLVWADAYFLEAPDVGNIGHRRVEGEMADAFVDFDMKRWAGR